MTAQKQSFDVIIIGGGPVGMMAALLMCQRGFKTALLDRLDYTDILDATYDGRAFAYAYGSKLILEEAGIWESLEPVAEPIHDIYVTAEGPGRGLHYASNDVSPPPQTHPMGYNIETRHFRSTVYQALLKHKNFHLFAPCHIQNLSFNEGDVTVTLANQDISLHAPLALAADGKNSFVRHQAGLKSKQIPYDQKALVLVLDHTQPHQNCAYEHFLKTGPLAILPMKGKRSGLIWSLKTDRADHYHGLSDSDLALEIERYFFNSLGKITLTGRRWLFPLEVTVVKNYVAPRLVLIGDAAHGIHPVAGQGFNLGLRDISVLSAHLSEAHALGLDQGSLTLLKAYEKKRRTDVMSMTGMCDGLVRLFSNDHKSLGHLRRAGLDLTNYIPGLKKSLTRHAMGL